MPLAVTHVILTIILVDLYRDYISKHKKYFTLHTLMIAGVASLLPDIDVPINWILDLLKINISFLMHGGFTHSLSFALLFLIPALYFYVKKNHKYTGYFSVIFFAICFHLFLDFLIGGGGEPGLYLLWPFSNNAYKLFLLKLLDIETIFVGLDAIILLLWLWHEERKHKILDYI